MEFRRIMGQKGKQRIVGYDLTPKDISTWARVEGSFNGIKSATSQLISFFGIAETPESNETFSKVCKGEAEIIFVDEFVVRIEPIKKRD